MRKNAKFLLVSLLLLCFAVNVNAAECSYEKQVELNDIASTVKATYEEIEIDTGETESYVDEETGLIDPDQQVPVYEKGFTVKVLNLTEDIYIEVSDDTNGLNKIFKYSDSDNGVITLGNFKADGVITYTITVRAFGGDCAGTSLRVITLVTPKYNSFSELSYCDDNPNFEYCQEYITGEDITYEEFINKSESYVEKETETNEQKEENKTITSKLKDFYKNNKKVIFIACGVIVIVGVATTAIIVIRRRSRLI
jgi:hypothetical protein